MPIEPRCPMCQRIQWNDGVVKPYEICMNVDGDVCRAVCRANRERAELLELLEHATRYWITSSSNRTYGATESEHRARIAKTLGQEAMGRVLSNVPPLVPPRLRHG